MATQRFEFADGNSAKFWQVQVNGKRTEVRYGRIGNAGRCVVREFATAKIAKEMSRKWTEQKKSKGYKKVNSIANPSKGKADKSVSQASTHKLEIGRVVDVIGIVGHFGANRYFVGRTGGVGFLLLNWKQTKGKMINGNIFVVLKKNIVGRKYDNALRRFKPYSIFRLKLKLEKDPNQDRLIGVIQKDYGKVEDKDLDKLSKRYRKPVSFTDPVLGKLTLNRDRRRFENEKAKWIGRDKISVSIEVDERANYCSKSFRLLLRIFGNPTSWEKKVKNFAARNLIENARSWQRQQEDLEDSSSVPTPKSKPISLTEFKNRITLVDISANDQGVLFWFDDDDIFWGHVIEIFLNLDGSFEDGSIAG